MSLLLLAFLCVFEFCTQVSGNSICCADLQYGSSSVCNRRECDVTSGQAYTITFEYRIDSTISSSALSWTATVGKPSWLGGGSTVFKKYNLCSSGGSYVLQSQSCSAISLQKSTRIKISVSNIIIPSEKTSISKDLYLSDGYDFKTPVRIIGLNIKSQE